MALAEGVMKVRWVASDFEAMASKTLRFAPEDVVSINAGLKARNAAVMAAIRPEAVSDPIRTHGK